MKWLETIKTTHEREATAIANNAEATEKANLHMFRLVVLIGLLTFGSLWVLTYLVDQFRAFRFTDIVLVLCFLAVYGFSRLPSMKAPSVLWLYCAFSVYAAVTILSGIFVTQNYVDVMIFVCLFQLPVLTLDRSLRVDLIEVILAAAYLLFVLPHKSPGLASTEVVNVGFFTASALAAGGFLRRTRIANFELERQSVTVHPVISLDATLAVREAVRHGAGLSVLPDFAVADDLKSGALIQVLPRWSLPSGGIHAVFPTARFRPAKVKAFVDLMQEQIRSRA